MRPSIALVSVLSILSTVVAQAQQQGRADVPAATQSKESEISTKDSDTAIKVEVNLVLVPVVVKDSSGNAVPGLKKEDFQLLDNGKPQTVSTFSVETAETRANSGVVLAEAKPAETATAKAAGGAAAPAVAKALELPRRFIALVFDDSHMKVAEAMAVHAATKKLFASLAPTDRVAFIQQTGMCSKTTQAMRPNCEKRWRRLFPILPRVKGSTNVRISATTKPTLS